MAIASIFGFMSLTDAEFEVILNHDSKTIEGDIDWVEDEDHSASVEFRAEILSAAGYPLFIRGSYNRAIHTLTYAIISQTNGRIYALDLGKQHRNADNSQIVGEKHKHRWTQTYRDKVAYVLDDITAPATDPVAVWNQFCCEAKIVHNGRLRPPPRLQEEFFP